MANYQESTGDGATWKRCRAIEILNPLNGPKSVIYREEIAARVGEITMPTGITDIMQESVIDLNKTISVRNPETGELTGDTITYGEVYAILYSAYMQLAIIRDTPPVLPPIIPDVVPEFTPEPTPEPTP